MVSLIDYVVDCELWLFLDIFITVIKHVFSCINIRQVSWEVLKTEAEGRGFQHLPRDLANVNALKNLPRDLANVNALKKPCSIAIIA